LIVNIKRVLAGASIIGVVGLPTLWLGSGVAAAEPERNADEQREDNSAPRWEIPPQISEEIAKNVRNLPSPVGVDATVPVNIPLPDVVPDLAVPIVFNPPALNVPAPSAPSIDPLNPLGLPPPPAVDPFNPLGLPPPPVGINPLNPLGLPPPPPPPAINPLNPLGLPPPPDPFNPLGLPRLW
jgi:hypothetical protein